MLKHSKRLWKNYKYDRKLILYQLTLNSILNIPHNKIGQYMKYIIEARYPANFEHFFLPHCFLIVNNNESFHSSKHS